MYRGYYNEKNRRVIGEGTEISPFSLYVEEKFNNYDKRKRAIAEKRITDVIFDVEMSSVMNMYTVNSSSVQPRTSNAAQNFQSQYYDMSGNLGPNNGSFVSMLQN